MSDKKPNFILFLADDQGWGDAGCYGATDLDTPHTDRLARQGVRCTQWYGGAPVCSPSRAALLSGRYPARAGVPGNVSPNRGAPALRGPTIAEALRDLGYQTFHAGKWHLGQDEGYRPHNRGFDDWFGFLHGCVDYYSHVFYWCLADGKHAPRHDLWHNNAEIFCDGEYVIDLIVEHALGQLRRAARNGEPFFQYVALNTPHYPMQAPRDVMRMFAHLPLERQLTAAMLWVHDQALGRILDELDDLGLANNTCVLVSSDHGPSREARNWPDGRAEHFHGGSTGGLRGHKGSVFEGGIRLPCVVRWPGVAPAGLVADKVGTHMDVFPTLLRAAGGDVADYDLDGRDITALWTENAAGPERDLFWTLGQQTAVRRGDWKLTLNAHEVAATPPDERFLADLSADRAEVHNLAAQQSALVAELENAASEWRAGLES